MSSGKKKKKKQKKSNDLMNYVDKTLDTTYDSLLEEIEMVQVKLLAADQLAKKKARKKMRKNPNYFATSKERIEARKLAIAEMEKGSLLDRVETSIQLITPIALLISRAIAGVILLILQFKPIQLHMKPETIRKMASVYQKCMAITI